MSDDKRLGANPLDWVARDSSGTTADSTFTGKRSAACAPDAGAGTPVARETTDTIFSIPETIPEEDLMGKGKIKIKQTMDTGQVVAHLEDLANSLSSGVIKAENGEDSIVLCVAETVKFELKLSRKKDRAKCSIEMEWDDDGSGSEGLKISG